MSKPIENEQFVNRLRLALMGLDVRPSPTIVANEFNLGYRGDRIASHTARNWLLGKTISMQHKLRVLADWLHVSVDGLRFGTLAPTFKAKEAALDLSDLSMNDRV